MTISFGVGQTELPWGDRIISGEDVTRITEEIAALGATSIKMSVLWQSVEPTRNYKYKFADLDRAIDAAEDAGLDILLIIEPRRLNFLAFLGIPLGIEANAKNARDYGLLCGAVAERYGDRIKYYEIGNEVNNKATFGGALNPSKYVDFLRQAYDNIKPHAPASTVLAGALMAVSNGWPSLHPVDWVKKFYECNPQEWFDGLSIHPYSTTGVFEPMTPTIDNEYACKNIDTIRQIMDDNGDGPTGRGIALYCTEWGFDSVRTLDGLSDTQEELEQEQARNIEIQYGILEDYVNAGKIFPTVWHYNYKDRGEEDDEWYRFGLVRYDWVKKPSWSFFRGRAVPSDVDAPIAEATATGLTPEVEVYVDPSKPIAPVASATATALAPGVIVPATPDAASATASGLLPTVTTVTLEVEYVSSGAGDRDVTEADDIVLSWTHDATGGNLLMVGLDISHENSKPWELYDILSVTSDLDGAFTRKASRHIASWSNKEGSVHAFELVNPSPGTHTITVHVQENDSVTTFTTVQANSHLYSGAAGTGAVAAGGSSAGGNTPSVSIASAAKRKVFAVFGSATDMTSGFTGDIRYSNGGPGLPGNGDFLINADKDGASTVTFASTGLKVYGAVLVDILSA